jgi:hypothetical protein
MVTSRAFVRRLFAFSSPAADEVEIEELSAGPYEPSQRHRGSWHAPTEAQTAAAIPFLVAAALALLPGYYDPLFSSPPDILGVPAGFVFQGVTLGWALLGALVVAQTRFRLMAVLALIVCTGPAVVGVVLMPQLIRVMQTLAV